MSWLPEEARKMLNQLVEMALRLGRDPTFAEVDQDPTMPKANSYAYFFGSFTDAQKEAHRIAFVYRKQESPLPFGKIFSEEEEKDMSRRAITDIEFVVSAIRLQKELGHFPNVTDVRNDKRCPSVATYERRFGTDWPGVKAAILRKAREMGINEGNVDNYQLPESKKSKPIKPAPVSEPEPPTPAPEPIPEEDIFMSETTNPTEPVHKFEPSEDYSPQTEGVADAILGPEVDSEPAPEPIPEPIPAPTKAELVLPGIFSEISAEPILPSEVEPEGNKIISLLPQTRIVSPKVEGYATVFVTNGLIPLQKTVLGVPVSQNHSGLNLLLNGQAVDFPEPQEGVFYIVERKIASIAKASGRNNYDLLIPEKFDTDENGMTIAEFSIL